MMIKITNPANSSLKSTPEVKVEPKTKPTQAVPNDSATRRIEARLIPSSNNVEFSVEEKTGISIVKVLDKETGEVIRQSPTDQVVELAKEFTDGKKGVFLRREA